MASAIDSCGGDIGVRRGPVRQGSLRDNADDCGTKTRGFRGNVSRNCVGREIGPARLLGILGQCSPLVALCTGVTETDCVVPTERLGIDQCPCHPRLVVRELDGLEGTIRNAQGWLPEALVATGRESET